MGVGATQSTRLTPAGVDAVRIGKDVIEILTSGMYVSPVTVYREYIQNAADSIGAARWDEDANRSSQQGTLRLMGRSCRPR
jgi:hypothetical protein